MDPPPSFFHHPPRYVPLRHLPPPPPPHQSFPGDPNFYPPPPPPPPHPPLPPYHHLPPPPPPVYNFSDNFPLRCSPPPPPPPRVRVSPELGPSFRFRDDYDNPFTRNYSNEFDPRVDFGTGYRHRGVDCYEPNPLNYDYTHVFRDSIVEKDTYGARHNRFVNSDVGFSGPGHDTHDCIPVFRETIVENETHDARHSGFVNSDVGFSRLGNIYGSSNEFSFRGRKEIFGHPKKVVHKTSALNRIQFNKSHVKNNRNEEHHLHSSSRSGELGRKNIRSRGSKRVEEERQESSVELNVSFKSNSLVAKAVEIEHSPNSTPKKRKISKQSSLPTKSGDGHRNFKEKVVRPMPYGSIQERRKQIEPIKKHNSINSLVVTSPQDEADTMLNDKETSESVGYAEKFDSQPMGECLPTKVSVEEDVYVNIGGSPIFVPEAKSISPHFSSPTTVKRTNIDESALSDRSDDSQTIQNSENASHEGQVSTFPDNNPNNRTLIASPEADLSVVGNVETDLSCLVETNVQEGHMNLYDISSDGHKNPVSIKERVKTATFVSNAGDSVNKTNNAIVVPENFAAEVFRGVITSDGDNSHVNFSGLGASSDRKVREIEWNLINPSAIDMLLKEVSEATPVDKTLSFPAKDHTSTEEHRISGTGKDSVCHFSGLSVDSCDSEFSFKKANRDDELPPKYKEVWKDFKSVSSSPMLSEDEGSVSAGTFTSSAEFPANTGGEDREVGSKFDSFSSNQSSRSESMFLLLKNIGAAASFDDRCLTKEDFTEISLQGEKVPFKNIASKRKRGDGKEFDDADTNEGVLCAESFQQRNPLETGIDTFQMQPVSDIECDHHLLGKDTFPHTPTASPMYTDGRGSLVTKLCDKTVESEAEADESESNEVPNSGSQEMLLVLPESQMVNKEIGPGQISEGKDSEGSPHQDDKPSADGSSVICSLPTLRNTCTNKNSGQAMRTINSLNSKFVNSMKVGIGTSQNLSPAAVPSVYQAKSCMKRTIPPASKFSKPRTWQRGGSPSSSSVPQKPTYPSPVYCRAQPPAMSRNVPSVSYVRKGNSLVRKTPSEAVIPKVSHALGPSISWLKPVGVDETTKITGKENEVNSSSLQSPSRPEPYAILERPQTLALSCNTELSNCPNPDLSAGSRTVAPLVDPPQNVCSDIESEPVKVEENTDLLRPANGNPEWSASREYSAGQVDSSESQGLDDGNFVSSRKLVYVKRKANQLVAASSSNDLPAQSADKTEALSAGGYIKRRKNLLVRNGLNIGMPDENLISEAKSVSQVRSSFQRRSGKVLGRTCKPATFSLVWTPHDAESAKKDPSLLTHVWPRLFPWKRASQRKRFTYNQASVANNGSLSTISRKLLLSRQRKTIYKRSVHGLSLRISKVLSVGGSCLKWSKSIEKNCIKANEEATLAVAAAERKKREKDIVTDLTAPTKSRSHTSRDHIFRVGSVRYKMDPSKRTLQRISDEESSCSLAVQPGKDVKKSSVPRRLVIGNQEYVRMGNGNQLIRNPKKRKQILANEKVRWSLHTARLCLARKKKYCQFFTRFGKCNKGNGKCPYIHDPQKIAVCTKFLKGSCSDSNCKLTHKVIPERMQDCSYFLQGLCANDTCPYRHVSVNPNASVCEGFLRGYCADGNECRKKHSYVCPVFESTGTCPEGSKCKLHHPKSQNKGKRKEPCREKNNFCGRYFGSKHISVNDIKVAVYNKRIREDDDDMFVHEGKLLDFIPLDFSDLEEGGESFDSTLEQECS